MNKSELIAYVAEQSGQTKADAQRCLDAMVEALQKTLAKGDKFSLTNVFTIEPKFRAAKKGRNPRDGSTIQIPAAYQVKFKAGKSLKEAANKNKKK